MALRPSVTLPSSGTRSPGGCARWLRPRRPRSRCARDQLPSALTDFGVLELAPAGCGWRCALRSTALPCASISSAMRTACHHHHFGPLADNESTGHHDGHQRALIFRQPARSGKPSPSRCRTTWCNGSEHQRHRGKRHGSRSRQEGRLPAPRPATAWPPQACAEQHQRNAVSQCARRLPAGTAQPWPRSAAGSKPTRRIAAAACYDNLGRAAPNLSWRWPRSEHMANTGNQVERAPDLRLLGAIIVAMRRSTSCRGRWWPAAATPLRWTFDRSGHRNEPAP